MALLTYIVELVVGTQPTAERVWQHFNIHPKYGKGKFIEDTLLNPYYLPMPGSSKEDREVMEQYQINMFRRYYGHLNLLNINDPMGGRTTLYEQKRDGVLFRYPLGRSFLQRSLGTPPNK